MTERILITGGAGLIGSALCERALESGARVTVLDNLSTGRPDNLPRDSAVKLVVGNVCDDARVAALVRSCDRVAHLAAAVGVPLILERPTASLRQSLLGTEIVLRHAAAARRPVFFASTSEVYGEGGERALREEDPVGFGAPDATRFSYAAGKAAGEALAFAYAHEYRLHVTAGRFFNVTGPRQSEACGAVVSRLVDQAAAGGPLTVHGDGQQTRCFLDARDAAEYVWRLMHLEQDGGRLVNIGRDHPRSILSVARRIRALVDPALRIEHVPAGAAYGAGFVPIRHRRPDVTRLRELTGYEPRVSFDATLRAFLELRVRAAR
ncbi:MAG: NAD-dependent epimerase/dehydratase family protein [Planctomycetota bacterium]|nr:NAD-dependent epimerase/dehydratase family protein [Planctomycetota bacterium]